MTFSFEPTNTQGPTLSPNGYEVNPCEIIQNKDFPPELRNNNIKYEPSILGSLSIKDLYNVRQVSKQFFKWIEQLGNPKSWDKTLENIQALKFITHSWGATGLCGASSRTSLYVNPTYDGSSISQIITLEDRLNNKFNYIECAWKVVIIQALCVQTLLGEDWTLEDDQGNEIIKNDSGYILERNATYNISHANADPSISRHLYNLNKFLRSLHMDPMLSNIHATHKKQSKHLKSLPPEQQEWIQNESTRILEAYTNMMHRIVCATLSKLKFTNLQNNGIGAFRILSYINSKENVETLLAYPYIKNQQWLFRYFQKLNLPVTKLSLPDPTDLTISIPNWAYSEIEDNNSLVGQVLALMSTHYQGGMDRFFPDTVLPKEVQILHAYGYQLPSTICSLNTLCQLNLYNGDPNSNKDPNLVNYGNSIALSFDLERGTYNPIENEYNLEPVITKVNCLQKDIMNSLPLTCQINQFTVIERQPFNEVTLDTLKDEGRAKWSLTFSPQKYSMSPQLRSLVKAQLIHRKREREEDDDIGPDPK